MPSQREKGLKSIALLNPLGDYGINAYSFELAEGLAANGVQVDIYTSATSPLSELPNVSRHRCYPVLGSVLFKQRKALNHGLAQAASSGEMPGATSASGATSSPVVPVRARDQSSLRMRMRRSFLSVELAIYLRKRKYDLIWTQWPEIYGSSFWRTCKLLGMRTAHTVHNVLPHEESVEQMQKLNQVYRYSDFLIVHSEFARDELVRLFPDAAKKAIVAPHGTYTVYPRRVEARDSIRRELGLQEGIVAGLICGGIRPYKNIDGVLRALADPRCAGMVLIVAGEESGYPDTSQGDRLARTRRLAEELRVAGRVRFIPRFLRAKELAELFEAADVLVLPYVKNYGSGLLLLGMTFGKHIAATDTGGASEYLAGYPRYTLLKGVEPSQIAAGLHDAMKSVGLQPTSILPINIPQLQWTAIAHNVLTALTLLYGYSSAAASSIG